MTTKPKQEPKLDFNNFSVKILGKTYQVRPLADNTRNEAFGTASYGDQLIQFNSMLQLEEKQDTILHEMIHCLDHIMQTNLEERQVHALASGIYAMIRDNPHFFLWLLGGFNGTDNKRP